MPSAKVDESGKLASFDFPLNCSENGGYRNIELPSGSHLHLAVFAWGGGPSTLRSHPQWLCCLVMLLAESAALVSGPGFGEVTSHQWACFCKPYCTPPPTPPPARATLMPAAGPRVDEFPVVDAAMDARFQARLHLPPPYEHIRDQPSKNNAFPMAAACIARPRLGKTGPCLGSSAWRGQQ
jgi:hypothetical protein